MERIRSSFLILLHSSSVAFLTSVHDTSPAYFYADTPQAKYSLGLKTLLLRTVDIQWRADPL